MGNRIEELYRDRIGDLDRIHNLRSYILATKFSLVIFGVSLMAGQTYELYREGVGDFIGSPCNVAVTMVGITCITACGIVQKADKEAQEKILPEMTEKLAD